MAVEEIKVKENAAFPVAETLFDSYREIRINWQVDTAGGTIGHLLSSLVGSESAHIFRATTEETTGGSNPANVYGITLHDSGDVNILLDLLGDGTNTPIAATGLEFWHIPDAELRIGPHVAGQLHFHLWHETGTPLATGNQGTLVLRTTA